ncbi:hypothetical protein Mal64_13600 [Pseudobythopirellula maris]|uniref:Aerotolerance regulator N-terminal domain-containing protein n=1 Tax=Pseudobythopirellula maris TaxID=2527991 RepID=A0A5C5ZVI8_9BACT|nr:BatA domain-containing protein [Pseudobythopirellula maris]TWT90961.1 hypothetical protein Mal64_13600 [Pseudobythopirellula maris]
MSFLTPALLAGALLIAAPIVLHLVMRREPQRLKFPALRFVKSRQSANQTRMQLRHWLLLVLRCLAIALLAFALARPVLSGSGLWGGAGGRGAIDAALSAALVFDNAPNSQYTDRNQTRLAAAKETALWLLEQTPADSTFEVVDRSAGFRSKAADRDAARLRVERLRVDSHPRPLEAAVAEALERINGEASAGGERPPERRQDIYLFTDFSSGAWNEATRSAVADQLESRPGATLYLIDVGVEEPVNVGLGALRLSRSRLVEGDPLELRAEVRRLGDTPSTGVAQLWLRSGEEFVKRDERPLPASGELTFALTGLARGLHQGFVQITGSDPLASDDRRHFTVEVGAPKSVLLVAAPEGDAAFVREAIAPATLGAGFASRYRCEVRPPRELASTDLDQYQAVMLLDPPPLAIEAWRSLVDFATRGGGVGVMLGRNAVLDAMNSPDAQVLLPAALKWRSREETYLLPTDYGHPVLAELSEFAEDVPWAAFPVLTYWELENARDDAVTAARYANGDAALVDRPLGRGRVLLSTTPWSDPLSRPEPWNLLPTGEDPWPFLLLANGVADTLCDQTSAPLNYRAGETAVAPLPVGETLEGVVLMTPDEGALRLPVPPGAAELSVSATDEPGPYRVTAGGTSNRYEAAFSVNLDPAFGELDRAPFEQIAEQLGGADRVRLVRNRDDLTRSIDLGQPGRELYPWLIALVAAAFAAEQLLSNRFYVEAPTTQSQ